VRNVYFDACYILALQENSDAGKVARNEVGYAHCHRERYNLKISIVALGEIFKECYEQGFDVRIIFDQLETKHISIESPPFEAMRIAMELRELDYNLDPCDALIAAHAIADPDAYILLSFDPDIVHNPAIIQIRDDLNSSLIIAEEFPRKRRY